MDFHSDKTRRIYSDRDVTESWMRWAEIVINPRHKIVADIGCGGGIYSKGFYELGASSVILVDISQNIIEAAKQYLSEYQPTAIVNSCTELLDLADETVDIVFERAVIHHLSESEKQDNLKEIFRILKPDGRAFIQDRTYQDAVKKDPEYWIRNALLDCFPHLLEFERARRPDIEEYERMIAEAGLTICEIEKLPEIRKTYSNLDELFTEISSRKGKSVLFELTDDQIVEYCQALRKRSPDGQIVEQDLWTVWIAEKT